MTIDKFITKLRKEKNIIVSIDGVELVIKGPKQHLTNEVIEDIKLRKQEILTFFNHQLQKRHFTEIKHVELKRYYKLSSAQQRLYFLWEFDKQSIAYNMPQVLELKGPLNKDRLANVFKALIDRHESLRTSFTTINSKPAQVISGEVRFEIKCINAQEHEIESVIKDFIQPFDLSNSTLFRVGLVAVNDKKHILLLDMHHIISDGFSEGILIKDFMALYKGEKLITPILQYKDYVNWQQNIKQQSLIERQKAYWLNEFSEEIEVLDLSTDFLRPNVKSFAGNKIDFEISKDETDQLSSLAREQEVSLFMLILSAFNLLLSKLSNREDIIIGTPTSGRYHADLENVIGMFVNTVVLRNQPKGNLVFLEFLEKVKTNTLSAFENQDYQYEDLISNLKIERNTSRNPLFDVMFVLQNTEKVEFAMPDLNLKLIENPHHIVSKFDLTLIAYESTEKFYFTFEYSTDLFKRDTIENYVSYFKRIISSITSEAGKKISDIEIISDKEKSQILNEFNNTKTEYPSDKTIIELFEEQVKKTPKAIALVYETTELTYEALAIRSTQLALYLVENGVSIDACVGILMDRSPEMIIGILGILKAGGVYVPIDVNFPEERINYIIADCNLRILLTLKAFKERCNFTGCTILLADIKINSGSVDKTFDVSKGNGIAYVMYTSGSTGNPKGVLIKHRSVVRLVKNSTIIKYSENERFLQTGNPVFDATTFEIWGSLLNGSSLYLAKNDIIIDSLKLKDFLYKHNISVLWLTASLFNQHIDQIPDMFRNVKYLLVGGDILSPKHINQAIKNNPSISIINGYGPTENTTFSTTFNITKEYDINIPIGKPISNSTVYILSSNNNLQPIGVQGELCVGGDGVAMGYLNNQCLTSDKFVKNPTNPTETLYRTGDLAKWLPDGNIEFLGRVDNQVKIRGFRIELGEVERQLLNHGQIEKTVVLAQKKGEDKYLVVYYISKKAIEITQLRNYLLQKLPEYMIPSYFVYLDEFPLTSNGKIDKKSLPAPELKAGDEYIAPVTKEEKLLVKIWSDTLGIKKIGIVDNFFALGGDSIKSIQIASRIRSEGYELSIQDLFKHQTIKTLSLIIKVVSEVTNQDIVTGTIPLTPIQNWFFTSSNPAKHHFNQSLMLNFPDGITQNSVNIIFSKIQEHHDALRIAFKINATGEIIQENKGILKEVALNEYDFKLSPPTENKILEYCNNIQSNFDLVNGPLIKLGLFHLKDGSRLLIVVHHLVIDGVSWRILLEDLGTLFHQLKDNKPLVLPLKSDSYQTWARSLSAYTSSSSFLSTKFYWSNIIKQKVEELPRDREGRNLIKDCDTESFQLTKSQTLKLLTRVNSIFGTHINEIFISALLLSFKTIYGHNRMIIDVEGHGREEIIEKINVTRTIGWFTSIYPVLLEYSEGELSALIKNIKETIRRVPNHGIDYLIWCQHSGILKLPENETNRSKISFNYLGQFESDANDESFQIKSELMGTQVSGEKTRDYDWDFLGIVTDGILNFELTYSKEQYNKNTVNNYLNEFKNNLLKIIDYCCGYAQPELTPSDLSYKNLSIPDLDELQRKYQIEDIYPLSPLQEGMLFHSLYDSESTNYFEQLSYRMRGSINVEVLKESLNQIISRHATLRTIFLHEGYERPLQLVMKERMVDFTFKDIQQECQIRKTAEVIQNYRENDLIRTFNLSRDALMRVTILQIHKNEFEFIWSFHHILMDGWCMGIIITEFGAIYSQVLIGKPINLPPIKPYSAYITWLEKRDKNQSAAYWEHYIAGYGTLATLPKKGIQSEKHFFNQNIKKIQINKTQTSLLQKISEEYQVTINTIFQVAWGILLSKYNNSNDVIFGSVVSGRSAEIEGVETIVGLFINTIPVRISFSDADQLDDLLQNTQSRALESEPYHHHPLSEILSTSDLGRDSLDHIIVFENYPIAKEIEGFNNIHEENNGRFEVTNVKIFEQTNYDLTVVVSPGEEISIEFRYNSDKYSKYIIHNASQHLYQILELICLGVKRKIIDLEIITEEEKHNLLYEFNNTRVNYPKDKTIVDLFEAQVERTPDNIAIELSGYSLTYKELNERANYFAYQLRNKTVKPDSIIALLVNRSFETIIGMLSVLKAGGAYLPIDADYPIERINYILSDSGTNLVLTTSDLRDKLNTEIEVILLNNAENNAEKLSNIKNVNTQNDLCYIIYTSGTTGQPKGVMVEHKNVVRLLFNEKFQFDFGPDDVWTMFHSHCFDFSVWEIYGALLYGGKLIIIPKMVAQEPSEYLKILKDSKVTILNQTPSAFYNLMQEDLERGDEKLQLRYVIFGGEALKPGKLKEWHKKYPSTKLINMFGITETTVHVTYKEIGWDEIENTISNIGKPIPTLYTFVLDRYLKLLPVGVPGELYVGGDGVARGYLKKEGLTKERFIANPFNPTERLYRTGDLVRVMMNGELEYLGRIDHQIQLRGFRIELGEIENHILNYLLIKDVAVVDREDGDGNVSLCAYFVAEEKIDLADIRIYLSKMLPDYMVPSHFVQLEKLPLTSNDKIDKKALPHPLIESSESYVAPRNELEKNLIKIWSAVLNVKKIGINDNFFSLGGDSIIAIRLISVINKTLKTSLKISDLFVNQSIADLSNCLVNGIDEAKNNSLKLIEQEFKTLKENFLTSDVLINKEEVEDVYPMSDIQKGLVFHSFKEYGMYHDQMVHIVRYYDFDTALLNEALHLMTKKHSILRTGFYQQKINFLQVVYRDPIINIKHYDITNKSDQEQVEIIKDFLGNDRNTPFDLENPLWRFFTYKLKDNYYCICFICHHAIIDGWSDASFNTELNNIYLSLKQDPTYKPIQLKSNYKDFVIEQIAANRNTNLTEFWKLELSGYNRFSFPLKDKEPEKRKIIKNFDNDIHIKLIAKAQEYDTSLKNICFSAFLYALHMYSYNNDLTIGFMTNNRPTVEDGDKILGCFMNTVPFRMTIPNNITARELLSKVVEKTKLLKRYDGISLLKIIETIEDKTRNENPITDIAFNYIDFHVYNQFKSEKDNSIQYLNELENQRKIFSNVGEVYDNSLFAFSIFKLDNTLNFLLSYTTSFISENCTNDFIHYFENVLHILINDSSTILNKTAILPKEIKNKILFEFNNTQKYYLKEKTIVQLFEEQAEKNPEKIALVLENERLSYQCVNEMSNRLAYVLRNKGIKTNKIVGLMLDRSFEMIIGILGILKAGGTYLPMDSGLPEERIKFLLDDCDAEILLSKSEIIDNYSFTSLLESGKEEIKIIKTSERPLNANFDEIPIPDRSLINYEKYFTHIGQGMVKTSITIQATRGCPYDCAYCCRVWPRKYVVRSAENIFSEINTYYKLGIKRFVFIDDIFNLNKENSARFFKLIIDNGLKINILFPSGLRGDILNEEYIDLMVKAGVMSFPLALETASPRLQKLTRKNLILDSFQKNLAYILKKYPQIILELCTMHGFPSETEEEAMMTLNFIKSHKMIHFPYIHILKIHSNTDMVKIAMDNGISHENIIKSQKLAYHKLPDTLPFDKNFTLKYQAEFLSEYFLSKERLLQVLPHQMRVLTEDEILQKYNSYLPVEIKTFSELLNYLDISLSELSVKECLSEESIFVSNFNENVKAHFKKEEPQKDSLKVLLLDLSQYFSDDSDMLYDVIEQPLGIMYVMTFLNHKFGDKINGKIAKSRMDFDSYRELENLLKEFNPDVIGIRSLSFYRDFFHKTVSLIKNWGYDVPIIAGGPYATTDYNRLLIDKNVDVVVIGEGEITFSELIGAIIKNDKKLPTTDILEQIPGLAFSSLKKAANQKNVREILLIDEMKEKLFNTSSGNLNLSENSSNLAYIIYTSGTTGIPKGVMTKHFNVTNVVKDTNYITIGKDDNILQLSNYAFDGSVFDIFGAILNGATLTLIKKDNISEIHRLGNIIKEENISILFVTTALFNSLIDYGIDYLKGLRKILFGGERVSFKHVERALQTLEKDKIIHVYGPTETTVFATYYPVNNIDYDLGTIPIGMPLSNTTTYILDKDLSLVPIGVPGELCISGDGNAEGYLGREQLTREKFIDNPYLSGEKLYRTGDLTRWLPDGAIEFLGRIDNQVKIRGYRIEPGEIEYQLSSHKSVKEVVVLVDEKEDNKTLVAYYVADKPIDIAELKDCILDKLPNYMVPSYFIQMEKMPLTVNGKIDKMKLPKPEIAAGKGYLAPSNETEDKLAEIWADVLKIKKEAISLNSNFFEFGGNSINSTALVNKIYKEFKIEFSISRVFELQTVKKFADYINNSTSKTFCSIKQVEQKEYYSLSSSQLRLYTNYLFNEVKTAYNMPFIFELRADIDKTAIEEFVKILVKRHESLRTTFHVLDNEMVQKVHKNIFFQVHDLEIKTSLQTTISEFSEQFDLSKAPLFKIGILVNNEKKYLLFDIHHIISDGISQEIIEDEFMRSYNGEELKPVEIQYKDFARWQKGEWYRKKISQQEKYWLTKFLGDLPVLNLPTDFARSDKKYKGSSMMFCTDENLTELIRQKSKERDVTLFMMLITIFKVLLSKLSGQQDIIVGVPIAGRTHPKLAGVVGMFVNYLPLRSYPATEKYFLDYLNEVKAETLMAFDNQDYQYDELVDKVVKKKEQGRNPLFDVVFNLANIGEVTNIQDEQVLEMNRLLRSTSKVDILITAKEFTNTIMFDIEYDSELFLEDTITFIMDAYQTLIRQICSDMNVELSKISMSGIMSLEDI